LPLAVDVDDGDDDEPGPMNTLALRMVRAGPNDTCRLKELLRRW
jgi:hypothetical protein